MFFSLLLAILCIYSVILVSVQLCFEFERISELNLLTTLRSALEGVAPTIVSLFDEQNPHSEDEISNGR